ncbi:hypothetical protein SZN_09506 [Streptomyces zinciresistens K42]|uniref:Uncharacterized protein n=1 Tax=Streptomyces zinciresistens K42 TaxID=700597 RepID=G2G8T3_9ACTN|nr:hypothetical protein [Streptomyces zinciresistens]EGX60148.1 hypothetical protein SZN_09506 [Streptomyces zinciresistens K42]
MSRPLQHRLHSRLELAAQILDLPLTRHQLERLAVELTPAVKAFLAEQADSDAETVPVRCAVIGPATDEEAGVQTTTYAQCTSRIGLDVDLDSPAARLAEQYRMRQPDVIATDVPSATYLGLTVRPQSLNAWRWWVDKLGIATDKVTVQGDAAYAVGVVGDVAVQVQAYGVPALLTDRGTARLMGLLAETSPVPT